MRRIASATWRVYDGENVMSLTTSSGPAFAGLRQDPLDEGVALDAASANAVQPAGANDEVIVEMAFDE